MSLANNITIVSSTSKAIKKAKVTGKLNTQEIFSLKVLDYLLDFIDETIANGSTIYVETKKDLSLLLQEYKYKNLDTICNIKTTASNNNPRLIDSNTNIAPTVSGTTISLADSLSYTFKVIDFTTNFQDVNGDNYDKVLIYLDGISGTFKYNGVVTTGTIELPVVNVVNLVLTRPDNLIYSEVIKFRVSDNNINRLYSTLTTSTITGNAIDAVGTTVIGDNTVYTDNRITSTLTLEMFTSGLTPPYNDPEGDLIDAIRIDEISTANVGVFKYNAILITEGLIITREDLAAGLFTHEGPDQDTISSDVFTFSARDEGSQIWVQ